MCFVLPDCACVYSGLCHLLSCRPNCACLLGAGVCSYTYISLSLINHRGPRIRHLDTTHEEDLRFASLIQVTLSPNGSLFTQFIRVMSRPSTMGANGPVSAVDTRQTRRKRKVRFEEHVEEPVAVRPRPRRDRQAAALEPVMEPVVVEETSVPGEATMMEVRVACRRPPARLRTPSHITTRARTLSMHLHV
jgi:hypothetical protein